MLEPLIKVIDVPCTQQEAFTVFIEHMETWWPLDRYSVSAIKGVPAATLTVDPRVGGDIVEHTADGESYLWGTIQSYEPHGYMCMDFHIPLPKETVHSRSLLELRFESLGEEQTRVTLTQSHWEAFGKRARMLQGGYGGGWDAIFVDAFASACQ